MKEKDPNPCQHCEGSNVYHTAVMKCPKCFWHGNRQICPACRPSIPKDRKYVNEEIKRRFDGGAVTNHNRKKSKETFTLLKKKRTIDCVYRGVALY